MHLSWPWLERERNTNRPNIASAGGSKRTNTQYSGGPLDDNDDTMMNKQKGKEMDQRGSVKGIAASKRACMCVCACAWEDEELFGRTNSNNHGKRGERRLYIYVFGGLGLAWHLFNMTPCWCRETNGKKVSFQIRERNKRKKKLGILKRKMWFDDENDERKWDAKGEIQSHG